MATNAPVPDDNTVPSARAERRRTWPDDTNGIWPYAGIVAVVGVLIICIVIFS